MTKKNKGNIINKKKTNKQNTKQRESLQRNIESKVIKSYLTVFKKMTIVEFLGTPSLIPGNKHFLTPKIIL